MSHTDNTQDLSRANTQDLSRYAWISIATTLVTIACKVAAYFLVDSVSLLSDAMESVVNLVAAIVALIALRVAARPADSDYTFGRSKAEYFSAALEGTMIFGAAALIIFAAIQRLFNPGELDNFGPGLAVSALSALINGGVGVYLVRAGKKHSSPALRADGQHLITDVITTVGVLVGVAIIWVTGLHWLDPLIAIVVALNIVYIGFGLIRTSLAGLMDVTLPRDENQKIVQVLQSMRSEEIDFHGLRTRASGQRRYVYLDTQVPGSWSVKQGHDFARDVEAKICAVIPSAEVLIHVEPIEDPASYEDIPEGYVPLDDAKPTNPRPNGHQ